MKFTLSAVDERLFSDATKEQLGFTKDSDGEYVPLYMGKTKIEINSLEELIDFVKKYGVIVFSETEIEIYNGYRE